MKSELPRCLCHFPARSVAPDIRLVNSTGCSPWSVHTGRSPAHGVPRVGGGLPKSHSEEFARATGVRISEFGRFDGNPPSCDEGSRPALVYATGLCTTRREDSPTGREHIIRGGRRHLVRYPAGHCVAREKVSARFDPYRSGILKDGPASIVRPGGVFLCKLAVDITYRFRPVVEVWVFFL